MKSRLLNFSAQKLLVAFLFLAQWQLLYVRLDTNRVAHVIDSDGVGYYDYLLRTFITRDYPFALKELAPKNSPDKHAIYPVNKYFFGEALALLPFFLTADFLTQAIRPEMRDGTSSYYQISVALAALFYLFLGLCVLVRVLRRMNYASDVINTILIILFLGTNLYYYALHEVSVSHVYSFAIIAFFLDQLQLQLQKPSSRRWLILSFLLIWITFIRPVNLIIVLALFPLAGSWKAAIEPLQGLFKKPGLVILCLIIGCVFIGIQSVYYFLQTGNFWVDSYGEYETFNFLDPQISNVLFSYRKGLFLYTPLLLLIFPGIWFYAKREGTFASSTWVISISLFIYVTSSWWYWAYGGSFGMRPVIDFYAIIVFPLAAFIEAAFRKTAGKMALLGVVICGVFLNLFQTWQYVEAILPYEFMTKSKYAHLFLQTKPHFKYIYMPDLKDKSFKGYKAELLYSYHSNASMDEVTSVVHLPGEQKKVEFIRLSFQEIFHDTVIPPCWLEITGEFKLEDYSTDASLVTAIDSSANQPSWFWNRHYLIRSVDVQQKWKRIKVRIDLPEIRDATDIFSVSVMNDRKTTVEFRNVNVRLLSK